ncbi:hypothetical protein [Prevotella disiens]|uniref:hypothetical protein n=1 Tax=Prevotella disiens TaxID=28130 RepID=UPI0012E0AE11|nr:hypothetical protein [Prevotella disiens]
MKKSKNCKTRTARPAVHSFACRGLSRLSSCVLIGLLVLSAASCRSSKKLTQESRVEQSMAEEVDSEVMNFSETRIQPVKVPMSSVNLDINLDSLRLLPIGAGYTARKGQAHVKVSRRPPMADAPERIIIEAGCDSLELACASLTKTVSALKKRLARQQYKNENRREELKEKASFNSVQTAFKWLLTGFLTGLILSKIKTIISFIKRKLYGK